MSTTGSTGSISLSQESAAANCADILAATTGEMALAITRIDNPYAEQFVSLEYRLRDRARDLRGAPPAAKHHLRLVEQVGGDR